MPHMLSGDPYAGAPKMSYELMCRCVLFAVDCWEVLVTLLFRVVYVLWFRVEVM